MNSMNAIIAVEFGINKFTEGVKYMRNTDENTALLKDLMKAPPMSASQHALIMRKRIEDRRMAEDLREASRNQSNDVIHLR